MNNERIIIFSKYNEVKWILSCFIFIFIFYLLVDVAQSKLIKVLKYVTKA